MIVRILGDGQYWFDGDLDRLNEIDHRIQTAVDGGDETAFAVALAELHAAVRDAGRPIPDTVLAPSQLVLPAADAGLADVRALLGAEGLVPG